MSTLKKVLLGISCVLALGAMIFGTDLFSYISTAGSKIRQSAKSSVPVEFEIERAKGMIEGLTPEIRKNTDTICQEEVALERLDQNIAALASRITAAKGEIKTLKDDLDGQPTATHFTYCGKNYSRSQVEADLSARFERLQIDDAQAQALDKMKTMRQTSLAAAKTKLQDYLAQKNALDVKLQQLTARKQLVEVAKTTSQFCFDSGQLGEAKKLVGDIDGRVAVEERMVGEKGDLANEVVLTNQDTKNRQITQRVAEYLGEKPSDAPKVAATK
jgi:peptidoglycan hydrolase CwlO-like protein